MKEFDNSTYCDGMSLLKKKYEDVLTNVLKMFLWNKMSLYIVLFLEQYYQNKSVSSRKYESLGNKRQF